MCGIAGKINFNKTPIQENEIRAMMQEIKHRGPDDSGIHLDGPVGLGHRRLSIIDLSEKGHQPMSDVTDRYTLVFNGEIYNYRQLRTELKKEGVHFNSDTDTEVLLYLYVKRGKECLKDIHGMFAFAIWDSEKKELFISRDRLGKKPLKYYIDDNVFIFASELKAILTDSRVTKEIDWPAIDAFLTHKYVPAPRTGFKNIFKLPPATYAVIKNGHIKIETYWDIDFNKKIEASESEWIEKIDSKLRESIKERLHADVPLGVHLSGGVDSSLIVALAAEESKKPITTFSIGFDEQRHNELDYARLVADQYNTDHHEQIVTAEMMDIIPMVVSRYEEPYADPSALPTWILSELTKKDITVVLNGDGGDENFAGYERNLVPKLHRILRIVPFKSVLTTLISSIPIKSTNLVNAKRILDAYDSDLYIFYENIIAHISLATKKELYGPDLAAKMAESAFNPPKSIYNRAANITSPMDRMLYTGIKTFLPDDLLVKVDIATMNHAVEARSPFLDHEFLELTAQIPDDLKIKGMSKKHLLKKVAEKYIPRECIYRPKQGFTVPINTWLRKDLNAYLRENVLDEAFAKHGFQTQVIEEMIEKHEAGKGDYAKELWTLLMLRLWLREWFET